MVQKKHRVDAALQPNCQLILSPLSFGRKTSEARLKINGAPSPVIYDRYVRSADGKAKKSTPNDVA
jgi:hypothetical protein